MVGTKITSSYPLHFHLEKPYFKSILMRKRRLSEDDRLLDLCQPALSGCFCAARRRRRHRPDFVCRFPSFLLAAELQIWGVLVHPLPRLPALVQGPCSGCCSQRMWMFGAYASRDVLLPAARTQRSEYACCGLPRASVPSRCAASCFGRISGIRAVRTFASADFYCRSRLLG
jgi:hypothetical protein